MKKYLVIEEIDEEQYDITRFSLLRKAREYAKKSQYLFTVCKILPTKQ